MKILSKYKDFYDFVSGIYGIDPDIVYDRRNATKISFISKKQSFIMTEKEYKEYERKSYQNVRTGRFEYNYKGGEIDPIDMSFCLEMGYMRYYYNFIATYNKKIELCDCRYSLIKKETTDKRFSDAPLNMKFCYMYQPYGSNDWKINFLLFPVIENPILTDTFLTSVIHPVSIWQNIYDYISMSKNKDIVDTRTNNEKIESYGFDKKTSFRNM